MSVNDPIIGELTHESATTRKVLALAPESKFDWKPHAKSMTLGRLVTHLAEIPGWAAMIYGGTEMSFNTGEYKPRTAATTVEALAIHDKSVADAIAVLGKQTDESNRVIWTLKADGRTVFSMPRAGVFRGMVLSHTIHHRGQLSVYLRLLDIPLPSIYGPTADTRG
jgi:uncharacterized damage-inducible protein DinB